jgi:dTDP-4-dehydrorhamnose reductase
MKLLLLGARGYMGQKFIKAFGDEHEVETLTHDKVNVQNLLNLFTGASVSGEPFDALINCAGCVGRPNVDAVEKNKEEAVEANVLLPHTLVEFANIVKSVTILHISTGCCYESDEGQQFTEEDEPNLDWASSDHCNFYAGTKSLSEKVIRRFPAHYICRLRMPFDNENCDRNYLSKLMKYDKLLSRKNSLSHTGDFVKACIQLIAKKAAFGTYNIVNSGALDAREVVELIKKYGDTDKQFKFFDDEAQFYAETGCKTRSNCSLSNEKLLEAGVEMRSLEEAIKDSLENWA